MKRGFKTFSGKRSRKQKPKNKFWTKETGKLRHDALWLAVCTSSIVAFKASLAVVFSALLGRFMTNQKSRSLHRRDVKMSPSIAFFGDLHTESAMEDVGMISLGGCSGKGERGLVVLAILIT